MNIIFFAVDEAGPIKPTHIQYFTKEQNWRAKYALESALRSTRDFRDLPMLNEVQNECTIQSRHVTANSARVAELERELSQARHETQVVHEAMQSSQEERNSTSKNLGAELRATKARLRELVAEKG